MSDNEQTGRRGDGVSESPTADRRLHADGAVIEERLDRLERAVTAMAWWLVQAQTGFAQRDAEAITAILRGERQ
jgi:hypothetical protein